MRTPRFFYFDLGNVLLSFDHCRACANMAQLAGVSFDAVWDFVFQGDLQIAYESGRLSSEAFHAEFCRATNSNPPLPELMEAASDMFEPIDAVFELAASIRRSTDQIGILSNTCPAHWEFVTRRFPQLTEIFRVIALSYELKCMKPAAEIYAQSATLAGHQPADIFFVDDREENIIGAKSAGYDAVLFHSSDALRKDLLARGVVL